MDCKRKTQIQEEHPKPILLHASKVYRPGDLATIGLSKYLFHWSTSKSSVCVSTCGCFEFFFSGTIPNFSSNYGLTENIIGMSEMKKVKECLIKQELSITVTIHDFYSVFSELKSGCSWIHFLK